MTMKELGDQNVRPIPCVSKSSRMCGPPHLQAKDCSRSLFREEAVDSRSLDAHPTVNNSNGAKRITNPTQMEPKGNPKGADRRKSCSKIMPWSV